MLWHVGVHKNRSPQPTGYGLVPTDLVNQAGSIIADNVSKRIEVLISKELKEVSASADGWDILYIDPSDGRYWELTYPDSGSHGGGAPKLSFVTAEQVKTKYGV